MTRRSLSSTSNGSRTVSTMACASARLLSNAANGPSWLMRASDGMASCGELLASRKLVIQDVTTLDSFCLRLVVDSRCEVPVRQGCFFPSTRSSAISSQRARRASIALRPLASAVIALVEKDLRASAASGAVLRADRAPCAR